MTGWHDYSRVSLIEFEVVGIRNIKSIVDKSVC